MNNGIKYIAIRLGSRRNTYDRHKKSGPYNAYIPQAHSQPMEGST